MAPTTEISSPNKLGFCVSPHLKLRLTIAHLVNIGVCYVLTGAIVLLGIIFGLSFTTDRVAGVSNQPTLNSQVENTPIPRNVLDALVNQNGKWHKKIVTEGYSFKPTERSSIAYFPLYPIIVAIFISVTGFEPDIGLLIISNICLAATFVLMSVYLSQKGEYVNGGLTSFTLLAMSLMPATLFLRLAYSESLFMLLSLFALFAMERRWPFLATAIIIGFATATRPVGIALLAPFVLQLWRQSPTRAVFLFRSVVFLPVACSGIGAFILYQAIWLGEPLAFVMAQENWGRPSLPFLEKVIALISFEPILRVYEPGSETYWGLGDGSLNRLFFCWAAVNPIYYAASVGLIILGTCKNWLSTNETVLAVGLLMIPYFTRGYEMGMGSHARFAAAVFPVYLVIGNILTRLPAPCAVAILGVSAFYLGAISALFATGYNVF
jgi:hypothetical protein